MISFLYLILILLINLTLLRAITISFRLSGELIEKMISSQFILITIVTIASLLLPADYDWGTSIIAILLFCSSLFINLYKLPKVSAKEAESFYPLLIIIILYVLFYGSEIRFFQSPDTHGFAATVGNFTSNFSYSNLVKRYLEVTGLDLPIFIGQVTPKLPSTWSIPDMQLRYAADMVFTVGRVGFPLYSALLGSWLNPIYEFPVFMLAFGIIGAFASSYLTIKIFIQCKRLFGSDWSPTYKELFLLLLILSLSFWPTLFILEGTLNQLWVLVACQFHSVQLLKVLLEKANANFIVSPLNLFLGPIFLSVVYPHGSPLLLLITIPLVIICIRSLKGNKFRSKNILFISAGTLSFIPLTLVLLHGSYALIISNVLKGISGWPYNLGYSNLFEYIPGFPYLIYPSATKTYINFLNYELLTLLSVCIFISLNVYLSIKLLISKTYKEKYLCMLLIIPIVLSLSVILPILKTPFSPYIFSRYAVQYAAIGLPISLSLINLSSFRHLSIRLTHYLSKYGLIIISLITIINFGVFSKLSFKYSEPFQIIDSMKEISNIDLKNSIIVSDAPDHRLISLTLFTPVTNLTSDWAIPYITPNTFGFQPVPVYKATVNSDGVEFNPIGNLSIAQPLHTPISAKQILDISTFEPIE